VGLRQAGLRPLSDVGRSGTYRPELPSTLNCFNCSRCNSLSYNTTPPPLNSVACCTPAQVLLGKIILARTARTRITDLARHGHSILHYAGAVCPCMRRLPVPAPSAYNS
jgi:hypothetical protein